MNYDYNNGVVVVVGEEKLLAQKGTEVGSLLTPAEREKLRNGTSSLYINDTICTSIHSLLTEDCAIEIRESLPEDVPLDGIEVILAMPGLDSKLNRLLLNQGASVRWARTSESVLGFIPSSPEAVVVSIPEWISDISDNVDNEVVLINEDYEELVDAIGEASSTHNRSNKSPLTFPLEHANSDPRKMLNGFIEQRTSCRGSLA